jgi:Yip1 domain
MTSSPVATVEAPEPTGAIARIIGVLFSPKATFQSIAKRPTWLAPIILLSLVSLGLVGLFGHRVGWRGFFEKQDSNSSRFEQIPPEQQRQTLDNQVKYGPPFVYGVAAISTVIAAVIIAAVLLGVFNGLGGAKFSFKTSLGIVAHAWIPGLILGLLGALVLFAKDPATIDLQNLVASNAGAFLSSNSPKWLIAMLTSLDVFSFWYMILMGIGYSAAAPKKLSFAKAFFTIFGLWAVYVLVRVGLTAAFS